MIKDRSEGVSETRTLKLDMTMLTSTGSSGASSMCAEKDYKESHHYYEGCGEEGPIRCANHHNFQCYLHRHETKRYVFAVKEGWGKYVKLS